MSKSYNDKVAILGLVTMYYMVDNYVKFRKENLLKKISTLMSLYTGEVSELENRRLSIAMKEIEDTIVSMKIKARTTTVYGYLYLYAEKYSEVVKDYRRRIHWKALKDQVESSHFLNSQRYHKLLEESERMMSAVERKVKDIHL
jgi:hypothetical protein